jgi:predicted DsbA family dithiol-disulfide isomerase
VPRLALVHFTDILCVWAYVSEVRLERLLAEHGDTIDLERRFCGVFGDARGRLAQQWADRGGLPGYAAHVAAIVGGFDHVSLHPSAWSRVAPSSSLNGHIFLAAIRHLERRGELPTGAFARATWALRAAFFARGRDVGTRAIHYAIAEELALPIAAIESCLGTGAAHAELDADFALAREHDVRMSPTLLLDGGRQRLSGNVGFRVITANVRELLRRPGHDDASWC